MINDGGPGLLRNGTCKEAEKLKVFDFQQGTDYTHKADGLEGIHNIHLGSDGMHSSDPDS